MAAHVKCSCTCKFSEFSTTHLEVREEFIAVHLMNSCSTTLTHRFSTGSFRIDGTWKMRLESDVLHCQMSESGESGKEGFLLKPTLIGTIMRNHSAEAVSFENS